MIKVFFVYCPACGEIRKHGAHDWDTWRMQTGKPGLNRRQVKTQILDKSVSSIRLYIDKCGITCS
jgi:hypothetical protein